jgi:hypothetical protein
MERAITLLHACRNIIGLTGTPFVNDEQEVNGVLRFLNMDHLPLPYLREDADEANRAEVAAAMLKLLQGHVAYWDPKIHRPKMYAANYPTETTVVYYVPMTWPQTLEYLLMRHSTMRLGDFQIVTPWRNTYNCQTLAIANASKADPSIHPKYDRIVADIAADPPDMFPHTIYDELIDNGIKLLQATLATQLPHQPMALITGETPNATRTMLRTAYNAGEIQLLGISRASATGMDLHGTQVMSLASVFDNIPEEQQTKCRVARLGSHSRAARKAVLYRDYVSIFPAWSTLTPAALQECGAFFVRHRLGGRESADVLRQIDLRAELGRMLEEEEYQTVEQNIIARNRVKFVRIQYWLKVFSSCTFPMRRQSDDASLLVFETLHTHRVYEGDEAAHHKRQQRRLGKAVPTTTTCSTQSSSRKRAWAVLDPLSAQLSQLLQHPLTAFVREQQAKLQPITARARPMKRRATSDGLAGTTLIIWRDVFSHASPMN